MRHGVLLILLAVLTVGPAGCGPQSDDQPTVADTPEPSSGQTTPQPELPAKALLNLDEVPPELEPPRNRSYDRELPAEAKEAIRKSHELRSSGDKAGAIQQLERAASFDPDNPKIRQQLGLAYISIPNYGKAESNLQQAAEYLGDDIRVQIILARLAMLQNNPKEALRRFRLAMRCSNVDPNDPQSAFALLNVANMLEQQGYWQASLEAYEKLQSWIREHDTVYVSETALQPVVLKPETLYAARGRLLVLLRRGDEAVEFLRKAYHRDRSDTQTAQLLLLQWTLAEKYAKAEELLLDMAAQPSHQAVVPGLAKRLCLQSGDAAMPLRVWESYRRKHPVYTELGVALAESAKVLDAPEDAEQIAESVLHEVPGQADMVTLLANLKARQGNTEDALELLAEMLARDPDRWQAIERSVRDLLASNPKPDTLEAFVAEGYRDTSERAFAMQYVAGVLARLQDNPLKAADHFRRTIELRKSYQPAYEALLEIHLATKNAEDLQVLLDLSREVSDEGHLYSYMLGRARLSQQKYGEAVEAFEAALRKEPDHRESLLYLADACEALLKQQDPTESGDTLEKLVNTLDRAVSLDPTDVQTTRRLFEIYLATGEFSRARELAEQLSRQVPQKPVGPLLDAEVDLQTRRLDDAAMTLARLEKNFPDHPDVRMLTIRLDLMRHEGILPRPIFERNEQRLRSLWKANPAHTDAGALLAGLLSQRIPGRYDEAAEIYRTLYERTESLDHARRGIQCLLRGQQFRKAETWIRALQEAEVTADWLDDALLEALVRQEMYDAALALQKTRMQKAEEASGLINDALLHWLSVCELAGTQEEALGYLAERMDGEVEDSTRMALQMIRIRMLVQAGRIQQAADILKDTENTSLLLSAIVAAVDADVDTDPAPLFEVARTQELAPATKTQIDRLAAVSHARRGDLDAAKELTRTLVKDSGEVQSVLDLAYELRNADKPGQAQEVLKQWISDLKDRNEEADADLLRELRLGLAGLYLAENRLKEANDLLESLHEASPKDPDVLEMLGSLRNEQGQDEEAIKLTREAVSILQTQDPDESGMALASARNNLAYMLSVRGSELDSAETMIREAIRVAGYLESLTDTLAWVHYKQGRFGQAGRYLLALMPPELPDWTLDAQDPEPVPSVIVDHLGDSLYRLGWLEQARATWTEALRLAEAETPKLREVQELIRNVPQKIRSLDAGRPAPVAPVKPDQSDKSDNPAGTNETTNDTPTP